MPRRFWHAQVQVHSGTVRGGRLKQLEDENRRLKQMVTDLTLRKETYVIIREGASRVRSRISDLPINPLYATPQDTRDRRAHLECNSAGRIA